MSGRKVFNIRPEFMRSKPDLEFLVPSIYYQYLAEFKFIPFDPIKYDATQFDATQFETVDWLRYKIDDREDENWICLYKIKDGPYALLKAYCDTSGFSGGGAQITIYLASTKQLLVDYAMTEEDYNNYCFDSSPSPKIKTRLKRLYDISYFASKAGCSRGIIQPLLQTINGGLLSNQQIFELKHTNYRLREWVNLIFN